MFPMKKTLIRAISFFLTLSLLTGLLIPFASAIEYEGVESMTVDATAALLIDPVSYTHLTLPTILLV